MAHGPHSHHELDFTMRAWFTTDVQGRDLRHGNFTAHLPLQVDLSNLPNGIHLFQAAQDLRGRAPATRFVKE